MLPLVLVQLSLVELAVLHSLVFCLPHLASLTMAQYMIYGLYFVPWLAPLQAVSGACPCGRTCGASSLCALFPASLAGCPSLVGLVWSQLPRCSPSPWLGCSFLCCIASSCQLVGLLALALRCYELCFLPCSLTYSLVRILCASYFCVHSLMPILPA